MKTKEKQASAEKTADSVSLVKPSAATLLIIKAVLKPWQDLLNPSFEGIERIPDEKPLLFVGNHTLFGVLDIPFVFLELLDKKGIYLRGLGDHLHFQIPLWGDLLRRFGAVDGTRENCAALMKAGESVLVFPGGGREVAKRKGEKYKLIWKERMGFAKMALQHGCTNVHFAASGVEDAFDIVFDADDMLKTPVGKVAKKLVGRTDVIWPVAKGIGPTPIPRPERLYFWFGEPIRTDNFSESEESAARHIRDKTKAAVESGIAHLLAKQAADPQRDVVERIKGKIRKGK